MKRIIIKIVLCAVLAMFVTGCEETFTPAQIQALAAQQEVLQQQIETVQAAATQMTEDLATAEIVDAGTVAKVAKINEEADRVQVQIDVIARALQDVPLTGDATQDFITQLQAANAVSSGFNPYVVPVGAGLSILSIALAWLAKRNAGIAAGAKVKYQAHKQGVEKTMKEVSNGASPEVRDIENKLYTNIGEARVAVGV